MSYLEKVRDAVTTEALKLVIPPLLLLLSGLLAGLVPGIRYTLLSLSPSWLLGLLAISLLANCVAVVYMLRLKREEKTQNATWETRLAEIQRENERLTAGLQRPVQESAPLGIELQILVLIAHNPDCT